MADGSVPRQRFRREIAVLPSSGQQRLQRGGTEPEHTAKGCNGRFLAGHRHVQPQFFGQLAGIVKVGPPAAGTEVHKIQPMSGKRRTKDAQIRVLLKFAEHIFHMRRVFGNVLGTDPAKACAHAAGFGLHGLFVMHKADVIAVPQQRE